MMSLPPEHRPTSAASDLSTSVGGFNRQESVDGRASYSNMGFERRVVWLEEDMELLRRRLRDDLGEANEDDGLSLRTLVLRLDTELAAERRAREALDARMNVLEESIVIERQEREAQLRSFSTELETTMRGLIGRIDDGLSIGAAAMRDQLNQTEDRLRSLVNRVDEGLSASTAALQESLGPSTNVMQMMQMKDCGPDASNMPADCLDQTQPVPANPSANYDQVQQRMVAKVVGGPVSMEAIGSVERTQDGKQPGVGQNNAQTWPACVTPTPPSANVRHASAIRGASPILAPRTEAQGGNPSAFYSLSANSMGSGSHRVPVGGVTNGPPQPQGPGRLSWSLCNGRAS